MLSILFIALQFFIVAAEDKNPHQLQPIMVLGNYGEDSSLLDIVPTVSTLSGDQLMQKRSMSLGETLKNEVGISSTSYGPSASRPVIRGLDGDRIRILQNGLGILDVSGASQDHAVSVDPLSMDSIEIVRGPLNLLYGSSAVGGIINIVNSRIHDEYHPELHTVIDSQLSSVDSGRSVSLKSDYGIANIMFHVDGNFRDSQDYKIKDYARSQKLRDSDPLPLDQEMRDKQNNSSNQTRSGAFGATYIGEKGSVGVSGSIYSSDYGVLAEPNVMIDMLQSRYDFYAESRHLDLFKTVRFKSAQSFYEHAEVEDGVDGTVFKNTGNESRLEIVQKPTENLQGTFGLQTQIFQLSALGDEAFLPKTDNKSIALFVYEDYKWNDFKINFGSRGEVNSSKPHAGGAFVASDEKSFFLGSVALGGLYKWTESSALGLNVSYNERAPNYQELFAQGAHVATFSYQLGDENLAKERSTSIEASFRHKQEQWSGVFTLFTQKFNNFIALNPSGTFDDTDESGTAGDSSEDLQIFNYQGQDATLYGLELDLRTHFGLFHGKAETYLKADYLRGKNDVTGTNLPRMTPPRVAVGLNYNQGAMTSDVELQQVFRQTNIAPNENETDAYVQTNLGMMYKFSVENYQASMFVRANNIFNVEARNHVSFLKEIAQVGGRNFTLGVRAYF